MEDYNSIKMGQRIRELRLENGLSQQQLAHEIGVTQNTISQYEKGTAKTSIDVLIKLASVFNASTDYILGLKDW